MDKKLAEVLLSDIYIDEHFNSRGTIQSYQIADLAQNIEDNGLIQPVTLMHWDKEGCIGHKTGQGPYKLVAGFRRTMAHRHLKRMKIESVIDDSIISDVQARIFNLSENLCREELNMLEEALAIQALFDLGLTIDQVADSVDMSFGWVQERKYLLELPEVIQQEASAKWLTGRIVRDLYSILTKRGMDQCLHSAKDAKDRLQRGEKVRLIKRKQSLLRKRKPSIKEIDEMMALIVEVFGPCLASRAMAYCRGGISKYDLHCLISGFAAKIGKTYSPPIVDQQGYEVEEEDEPLEEEEKEE